MPSIANLVVGIVCMAFGLYMYLGLTAMVTSYNVKDEADDIPIGYTALASLIVSTLVCLGISFVVRAS
jgi:TRAP-type C4-dicarboxylate transport system permease small subunit